MWPLTMTLAYCIIPFKVIVFKIKSIFLTRCENISICLATIVFASPFEFLFYLFICGYDMLVGFIIFSGFFFFFWFSVKGLFWIEGRERIWWIMNDFVLGSGDIRRPYGGINKSNFAYLLIPIFVNNFYDNSKCHQIDTQMPTF